MDESAVLVRDEPLSGHGDLQYSDGVPMESPWHRDAMMILIETARAALAPRAAYVSGDQFIYFSKHQIKKNDFRGPDFYLVVDVPTHERKYWASWEEDGRLPDLVVELTSESTEHIDRGEKFRIYDEIWKVQGYYLWDPVAFRLEGWARGPDGLEPLQLDADGGLDCPFMGLRLGPWTGDFMGDPYTYVRWFRRDGELVLTRREEALLAAEAARADAAKARSEAAKARTDAANARTDAAKARTDAEASTRRIAELEALLRGQPGPE